MEETLGYYNKNARMFSDDTKDITFRVIQDKFLSYLGPGSRILDFGCGSGRDTRYFLSKGFYVDALDGSEEMVKIATENTKIPVQKMLFQELDSVQLYDGIWACSSILHLTSDELSDVLQKIWKALADHGILYTSFKYGEEEGIRKGRFFNNMTECKWNCLLEKLNLFETESQWVSNDARPLRGEEKWLNVILRKK